MLGRPVLGAEGEAFTMTEQSNVGTIEQSREKVIGLSLSQVEALFTLFKEREDEW